jgi:DNA repair photolyase
VSSTSRRGRRSRSASVQPPIPYQPIEGTYKLSRGTLEALRDAASPVGIVTKGPMIVRDKDVLQDLSKRTTCRVHISIPTVDEDAWEKLEPGRRASEAAAARRARARRCRHRLRRADGADRSRFLDATREDRSAPSRRSPNQEPTSFGAMVMHLEGGTRDHFMTMLQREYPEMVAKYTQLYRKQVRAEGLRQARAGSRLADARALRNQVEEEGGWAAGHGRARARIAYALGASTFSKALAERSTDQAIQEAGNRRGLGTSASISTCS